MMARRNWPDHGRHPRCGFSAPGNPWVQELDGPIRIKALLIVDSYSLTAIMRTRPAKLVLALALTTALVAVAGCGDDNGAGNPDSRLSSDQASAPLENGPDPLAGIRSEANELLDGGVEA